MKKYLIIIVICFVSILTIATVVTFYRFYAPGAVLMYTFFDSQDRVALNVKPTKRIINEGLNIKDTSFVAYGYSMYLPWQETPRKEEYELASAIMFGSNQLLSVHKPKTNVNVYTEFSKPNESAEIESLKPYFNIRDYKSNFEFVSASLHATFDRYSIFSSYGEVVPLFFLLMNKRQYISIGNYDAKRIYFFQTDNCKAIQIGDPNVTKNIELYLFADDNQELEVMIVAKDYGKVIQEDIDYIVANFMKDS